MKKNTQEQLGKLADLFFFTCGDLSSLSFILQEVELHAKRLAVRVFNGQTIYQENLANPLSNLQTIVERAQKTLEKVRELKDDLPKLLN